MRLRLASYNLHKCRGTFGPYAPEQNLAVIAGLGADIVALQEVDCYPEDGQHERDRDAATRLTLTATGSLMGAVTRYSCGSTPGKSVAQRGREGQAFSSGRAVLPRPCLSRRRGGAPGSSAGCGRAGSRRPGP